jgi:NitT/TauT family transport system permease protein
MKEKTGRYKIWIIRLLLFFLFLGLWEEASHRGWIDKFFVSMPSEILSTIFLWLKGYIYFHIFTTLTEMILGFAVAVILGIAVGFLFAYSNTISVIFEPLMVILNAMPRIVIAPLFVLWFGLGLLSKVAMVITVVFFIVFFNTYRGIKEVDRSLIDNARILGASKKDMICHVLMPSALTWIFGSLRTSIGFALIGAIIGEYMGSDRGMGYIISYGEAMFDSKVVLSGLVVLLVLVGMIDFSLQRIEKHFSHWKIT